MLNSAKGHAALRRGRWSVVGASYFLTICTEGRRHGLASSELGSGLLQQAQASDAGWRLRAAVVMPDHVHLIIKLEEREDLAEVVRRFKGRTSVSLRRVMAMKWQRGYFDHRLRAGEDMLPVFLYLFLNPYRAGLVPADQPWPLWFCAPEDWAWLGSLADRSCPLPAWLD